MAAEDAYWSGGRPVSPDEEAYWVGGHIHSALLVAGVTSKTVSDLLGLTEATPLIAAQITVTDVSNLAEAISIAADIPVSDPASLADTVTVVKTAVEERLLGGRGLYLRRRRRRVRRYRYVAKYGGRGVLRFVGELESVRTHVVKSVLPFIGTSTVTSTLQGEGTLVKHRLLQGEGVPLIEQCLHVSGSQLISNRLEAKGVSTRYKAALTALLTYIVTGDR